MSHQRRNAHTLPLSLFFQPNFQRDRQLKADLIGPMKRPNSSGTIFLEGKKEMRARGLASPDAADALAVTFSFPIAHREYRPDTIQRIQSSRGASSGWMGS
jgi:hypothetical protein